MMQRDRLDLHEVFLVFTQQRHQVLDQRCLVLLGVLLGACDQAMKMISAVPV